MAWTTTNGLGATRTVHQKRYAEEAEEEMVAPPAFPRRRHLEIASLDGSRSISSFFNRSPFEMPVKSGPSEHSGPTMVWFVLSDIWFYSRGTAYAR